MKQSQLTKDLSGLIEWKINERNRLSKLSPRPDGIIKIIDREIDILEKIECYIPALEQQHAKTIIECQHKYFNIGIKSGKIEQITGRHHPAHLFL